MIYVLTGKGKGKTTCALGMGMRAAGAGKKVLMTQFLKDGSSSEINVIKKINDFEIRFFGRPGFGPFSKKDSQLVKSGFLLTKKACLPIGMAAQSKKCEFLILDEINVALHFKLLGIKEVLEFLKEYGKKLDVVLTGRYCPKEIIEMADLVTEFKEVKHYFKKKIKAREGIEY